ncbi:TRAP transporter large permease [Anaerobacillus isosaccharinicus]|uniref:TRAP transporter large permease n=1 Tax=Anaerobacillus isosaccharinicus TaxID=1532552 RepID=A0A1S2M348_9BACI|nr:TRAP transporter large permease [Anaerobacillus isosaccharinicus]MBA5586446.1 TRAP transporter large permease [Anaerobacillus isosaccharinicus]QOY35311.1 TRAP transporter large permease [Anaerobacillus isosaccharinicus]
MFYILVSIFLILLLFGTPIFIAIIIPSLISFFTTFQNLNETLAIQRLIGGIDTFSLLAIPFFMFAAAIMSEGRIGGRLVSFVNSLVGHLPGGLALATVVTCTLFGAISGTGPAAIVAVGTILLPALLKEGYSEKLALGTIVSSSTLSMLIPPGVAMILYGVISGTSIGKVFISGISVGLLTSAFFMLFIFIYAKKYNLPRSKRATFKEVLHSFIQAFWALGFPVVILGGIYLGIVTPTEAAAIAVAYVIIVELLIYRSLKPLDIYRIAASSGRVIAMIFILIAAGSLLSWLLTVAQIPQMLVSLLDGMNPILILLLINVIFLIAGMFLDPNSSIIILTPLVYPVAMSIGVDPVHLGILIVMNASIGMITPPFGLNIFVATGTFKVPYERVVPGLVPFIFISIITLLLVTFIPEIALWLPNLMP